ncbi:MAG: AlkZ family DNA glycosylase [Caldilineaceae bacterium]|nr:AlkZ family DNA glycosylase [Caldilineaceae bacterium]
MPKEVDPAHPEIATSEALALRLSRQYLDRRAPRDKLVYVAREIGGVQAQSTSEAYIGLLARMEGLSASDIDRALLDERVLIRTWAMRQTVHLLPSDEFPSYMAALNPVYLRHHQTLIRKGLDEQTIEKAVDAAQEELASGPLTRKELIDRIPSVLIKKVLELPYPWNDLLGLFKDPYALGKFCFGPPHGQETTFVRVDKWLPSLPHAPAPHKAEEHLLQRYLCSFGPATISDFAHWSGFTESYAQTILSRIKNRASEVSVGSTKMLIHESDLDDLRRPTFSPPVRLLPSFDAYLLGYQDKSPLLDKEHYQAVFRKSAQVARTIIEDGRVTATWSGHRKGKTLMVHVAPFGSLSRSGTDGITIEADTLARFLGMQKAEVQIE